MSFEFNDVKSVKLTGFFISEEDVTARREYDVTENKYDHLLDLFSVGQRMLPEKGKPLGAITVNSATGEDVIVIWHSDDEKDCIFEIDGKLFSGANSLSVRTAILESVKPKEGETLEPNPLMGKDRINNIRTQ